MGKSSEVFIKQREAMASRYDHDYQYHQWLLKQQKKSNNQKPKK